MVGTLSSPSARLKSRAARQCKSSWVEDHDAPSRSAAKPSYKRGCLALITECGPAHTYGARAGVLPPSGRGNRPPKQIVINKRLVAASSLKVARQLDACINLLRWVLLAKCEFIKRPGV